MNNKVQKLDDFSLIQGEYLNVNISVKRDNGSDVDISSMGYVMNVHQYGNRDNVTYSVVGTKTDINKVTFKLPSSETRYWNGKLEYIISVAYSNGDKSMGLGYITMV